MIARNFRPSFFGPVLPDRRGVAAVFLAVALVPMFGAIGLAVDSSLGYLLKTRMSKSLDTAGLAAGRVALNDNAEEVAREYFDANFGAGAGSVELTDFDFELDDTGQFVTLTADATTPTVFMRVFGQDEMTVSARTVIQRETTGMELALVLDNTGSMWAAAPDHYRHAFGDADAAYDLIDIIYGDENEIDNVWVSLVPYVATVNIGNTRTGWLAAGDRVLTNLGQLLDRSGWKGCVMAQRLPYDADDTPPARRRSPRTSTPRPPAPDNNWPTIKRSGPTPATQRRPRGPNLGCGPAITPLTAVAGDDRRRHRRHGRLAPRRHHRQPRPHLGLAHDLAALARPLGRRHPVHAMPLDYDTAVHGEGRGDPDRRQQPVPRPDSETGTPASDFTAYGRVETPLGPVGLAAATRQGRRASSTPAWPRPARR